MPSESVFDLALNAAAMDREGGASLGQPRVARAAVDEVDVPEDLRPCETLRDRGRREPEPEPLARTGEGPVSVGTLVQEGWGARLGFPAIRLESPSTSART